MIRTNEDWQHGEIPEGWTYICKYPLSMSDFICPDCEAPLPGPNGKSCGCCHFSRSIPVNGENHFYCMAGNEPTDINEK